MRRSAARHALVCLHANNHAPAIFRIIVAVSICLFVSLFSRQLIAAVVINEFMASNDSVITDEDGDYSDWIELYNNGLDPVNLDGWFLTDDETELNKWQFPSTSLAAGNYLLIFASDKERAVSGSPLHTNFKLSSGGEYLALVLADGVTISDDYSPEYPQQYTDISYKTGSYFTQPTPGTLNNSGVSGIIQPVEFSIEHGFYQSSQSLVLSSTTNFSEIRYTTDGSTPVIETGCQPPADGKSWIYDYYEGVWSVLPNFDVLTPISSGTTDSISLVPRQRDIDYGLRFKGCIHAQRKGLYSFSTNSDDGSQLLINGVLVVDNDGLHSPETVADTIMLEKGLHEVEVTMFQRGGGQVLEANWAAPARSNAYVTTIDNNVFVSDPITALNSTNFIEFEFDLTTSGQFSFDARVQGISNDSDSFWVQLDDGPLWLFDTTQNSGFINQLISDRNTGIVSQALISGTHTLRIYLREDGTRLDSVTIIGNNCDGPCEPQLLEAEAASVNGDFVAAGSQFEGLVGAHWQVYSNPITIDATSTVRAVALRDNFLPSPVVTQSYLFVDDIVQQSINGQAPQGWPSGPVNGQILNYGMDPEIVNSNPQAVKDALVNLPALSIVTDLDHLFHPALGIYVNAQNKGRYWERPISVELIDPSGTDSGFTQDAGARMRGGFSRTDSNPKHAFRLFFRGSYSGELEYPLFGNEGVDKFEKVDLRTPQNYSWSFQGDHRNTFLREIWSRDTQAAMGHNYTKSRYYNLYINGVYWGIYMSQERISKEFASSYLGGSEDDYDVIKHNRSDNFRYEATDGTNDQWNELWNMISDKVVNASEYQSIAAKVDLENLIEYIMVNAYEGDTDGAPSDFLTSFKRANNWYAVFDHTDSGAKWSFYQHDGEHSLGVRRLANLEENVLGPFPPFDNQNNEFFSKDYLNPYWLHASLTSNPDYRQLFIDRSALHFSSNGVLSPTESLNRWNQRKAQVAASIIAESARWGDSKRSTPYTINDWQNEVNFVENNFFPNRSDTVLNQLIEQDLASSLPIPALSIPSGSIVEPGTELSITNTSSAMIYYTLDGTDPRLPGAGISPNALLLLHGETIVINANVTITLRYLNGNDWGPISQADFIVNTTPVIDPVSSQITTNTMTVNLNLTATDDDDLEWSAINLPNGLDIDAGNGLISGTINAVGVFDVTVTVNDGTVSADTSFLWWVVPKATLILNEYNALSSTKYLGGGDDTTSEPSDQKLGRIIGNGGNWFELVVVEDHLDIRNWQLSIVDDGAQNQLLSFTSHPVWSDLRAGTIITVSDNVVISQTGTQFGEDISYSPGNDDWWIHVIAGLNGSSQYITASEFSSSNKDWQIEILDASGQTVFGPMGEGIGQLSGVNSEEVGKLEENPQPYINPGSNYNDGTTSSFGEPNRFNAGTQVQDFNSLRSVISSDPGLSIANVSVDEDQQQVSVRVTASAISSHNINFQFQTRDISALAGQDYTAVNSFQTIPAGEMEKEITLFISNDTELENIETFAVEISNVSNATITNGNAVVTINDDDGSTNLPSINVSDTGIIEGRSAKFIISLSQASTLPVNFTINTFDITASGTTDYVSKSGRRSIAAGVLEKTIWVQTFDDAEVEADETFSLEISDVTNAQTGDISAIASIQDNDSNTGLTDLSIADASVIEGSVAAVIISLSQAITEDISIQILSIDESATSGTDYSPKSGRRIIRAGDTEKTIWIPVAEDDNIEQTETFRLELSSAINANIIDDTAVISITDNDSANMSPILSIADTSVVEGRSAKFIISLSQASQQPVSFTINTQDGSALATSDYSHRTGRRNIAAGSVEKIIWVATIDDANAEADETFSLQISDVSSASLGNGQATATINDND